MTDKRIKICFLGSGDIAVPVLRALLADRRIEVVAVGTQPDRPAGRRRIDKATPVGEFAAGAGLTAERIADVNEAVTLRHFEGMAPDFVVVVSFGQLLKRELLNLPRFCCLNVHASLLPSYRGASPIVQAILNRDAATGVTFMEMETGLDCGPVYRMIRRPLDGTESAGALELELGEMAGAELPELLIGIASGKVKSTPQNHEAATKCRKIRKSDGQVDWRRDAAQIEAMVRAFENWPGAFAPALVGKSETVLTVRKAVICDDLPVPFGECAPIRGRLIVGCGDGRALEIVELSPSGGKIMSAADFLNGLRGEKPRFMLNPRDAG